MYRAFTSRLGLLAVPLLCAIASSAAAIEPFVLVDKNGKVVGPILDMPYGDARVPFRVGNQRVTLIVSWSGIYGRGKIYYEAENCAGQPYMYPSGGLLADIALNRRRVTIPDGPARLITVRAYDDGDSGGCTDRSPYHDPFVPAKQLIDPRTRFTPPFRIEASDEVVDLDAPVTKSQAHRVR